MTAITVVVVVTVIILCFRAFNEMSTCAGQKFLDFMEPQGSQKPTTVPFGRQVNPGATFISF